MCTGLGATLKSSVHSTTTTRYKFNDEKYYQYEQRPTPVVFKYQMLPIKKLTK